MGHADNSFPAALADLSDVVIDASIDGALFHDHVAGTMANRPIVQGDLAGLKTTDAPTFAGLTVNGGRLYVRSDDVIPLLVQNAAGTANLFNVANNGSVSTASSVEATTLIGISGATYAVLEMRGPAGSVVRATASDLYLDAYGGNVIVRTGSGLTERMRVTNAGAVLSYAVQLASIDTSSPGTAEHQFGVSSATGKLVQWTGSVWDPV